MSATFERTEAAVNSQLGRAVPRRDGPAKVKGEAQYVDDLPRDGVWIGATIRSPSPHGVLRGLRFAADFDPGSVVVVTAADIPGENVVPVVLRDQPSLADKVVRYVGEPVALVAAPDEETLRRALDRISVDVDPLPACFDIDDALSGRVRVYGEDNLLRRIEIQKGDCDEALDGAEVVVEGEYFTGAQEHVYLEPQGMQAEPMGDGMLLRGSMQCPNYLVEGVAVVLGWAPERVRVIPCTTGGGFGGKEDFPTMVAGHAALLAWKAKRPVRLIYSRVEDLAFSSKRHPSRVRHRTGWTRDGRLVAMRIDVDLDGGAYGTLSPLVLQRAAVHAAGPYRCDHVTIVARAVATNHPPRGAFRGFGAPQSLFALEAHMDRCAAQLKIDPIELRRRNHLGPGDSLATGQCVHGDAAVGEVLERALAESRYFARRAEFDRHNA
ncbi:MAG TPA: xanthine dehydrogenase family protein, partial [Pirellulaceae bacterium]|nr:xanthine dehydrogenase family protein [Pirellulaceae bacterium]